MSKLTTAYLVWVMIVCGGYGVAQAAGWELDSEKPEKLPPSARNAPGGYRAFGFWHSGFRGGK